MAKRPAEEPLESLSYRDSPSIKKVRVEFAPEGETGSNGFSPSSAPPIPIINGREFEEDARNGKDILAAADQLEEELQEAAVSLPSENEDGGNQSAFLVPSRPGDILAAADQLEEELQEAAVSLPSENDDGGNQSAFLVPSRPGDMLAAADQLEEELQEAAVSLPSENEDGGNQSAFLVPSRPGNMLATADQLEEELQVAAASSLLANEDEEEEQSAFFVPSRQAAPVEGYTDLYLDTINRAVLDFDFEKLCSVTLSNINVYACLVCGKYFQGRGPKSHAYFHALEIGHHVYVNMQTKRVYVLPEGYEVKSKSLDDIKFVVDPRLSKDEVLRLDKEAKDAWDLGGKKYRPGFVGMNNIKANDYFNVIIQALAHIPPLRNFLMLEDLSQKPELVQRFSVLVRKIWNTRAFKSHVSPHELLQQVSRQSQKKFDLLHQSDPVDFLSWFLNNLHLALGGSKTKPGTSIVQKVFQGKLKVESQQITAKADAGDRLRFEEAAEVLVDTSRYLMLTLDLPAAPLFQDELDKNIIPQVPLTSILAKYDGIKAQEHLNTRKRYRLLHPLPPYLLFHIKRFSKNKFVSERNPTIVTFPVRSLDMSPYIEPNPSVHPPGEPIWYDLVANVTHEAVRTRDDSVEGEAERKVWRVQVRDRAREEWLQMQDLYVERVPTETLFTKESYLMVWEKRREVRRKGGG